MKYRIRFINSQNVLTRDMITAIRILCERAANGDSGRIEKI
jgi:hypothetical protein